MRYGMYPGVPPIPFSPGYDVVGVVDKPGEGVTEFRIGDTVAALTMFGGYSRYLCVPATELTRVHDGVDAAEAVSLVLNYTTAQQMIHRVAQLRAGRPCLITERPGALARPCWSSANLPA